MDDKIFFWLYTCRCEQPINQKSITPGKPDTCRECNLWAKYSKRTCIFCRNIFIKCYSHPNMGPDICWDCIPNFNMGYTHRPDLPIIPPHHSVLNKPFDPSAMLVDLPEIEDF